MIFSSRLFRISKISTFESNSQHTPSLNNHIVSCSEYQRYQLLRAIHNNCRNFEPALFVVPNIKDINFWEQFTTIFSNSALVVSLFRISKISTFESNSQQPWWVLHVVNRCSEYQRYQLLRAIHNCSLNRHLYCAVVPNIKDINFWEQFTTKKVMECLDLKLFRISKISTFESNSQRA